MNCPRCHHTLREITYEGVAVDTCDSCGGEWLDKDEILLINRARGAVFNDKERSQVEGAQRPVIKESVASAIGIKCPICSILLKKFNYAYDSGIMVDRCPQCDGLWLDKGELENLQIVIEEWEKKYPEIKAKFSSTLSTIQAQEEQKRKAMLKYVAKDRAVLKPVRSIFKSILYRIF